MLHRGRGRLLAGAALVAAVAAGPGVATAGQKPALVVDAFDFGYTGVPAELAAGKYKVDFSNSGAEFHELAVVELSEKGAAASDPELLAAADAEDDSYISGFAGGAFAPPGEDGKAKKLKLAPGSYAYFCFIPSPDGVPHYRKGMFGRITVK